MKSVTISTCLLGALLLTPTLEARAVKLKSAINASIRAIRATQNEDGSYGPADSQPTTTARFLLAAGTCEEHYTTFDGPFIRNAVLYVLTHQTDEGWISSGADPATETAEVLAALRYTAPGLFEDNVQRARKQLETRRPAASNAGIVQLALGEDATTPVSDLRKKTRPKDDGQWIAAYAEEVAAAQPAVLTTADVPAAVERLLVFIDLLEIENAHAKAEASASPADSAADRATRRAAPRNAEERRARIMEALAYLDGVQHDGRFGFGDVPDPGVSAIALSATMRISKTLGIERPAYVDQGLDWLLTLQKADGGIYDQGLANYVTSISVEAMAVAGDARFEEPIRRAVAFLRATQLDEGEGYSAEEDPYYGGFGYGGSEKPDLSNTQMAAQALHEAGVPTNEETWAKVIGFLEQCQNLPETGAPAMQDASGKTIVPGDDGGAVYRPGNSKAGDTAVGDNRFVANSYGSMTYSLLKTYLFAGLDAQDPRVKAAVDWIQKNYTLDVNPGFPLGGPRKLEYQGLYYYYLSLARALDALGIEVLVDGSGKERHWKAELDQMLFSLQAEDGHWINTESSRWMEGNPILTTSYAILALCETS